MKRLEDILQEACVTWFKLQYPKVTILHPKNEGNRKSLVSKANGKSYSPDGNRNKKMGVLAGTPDLFVMKVHSHETFENNYFDVTIYHGLWIELKAPGRTQSKEQKEFEVKAKAEGYAYYVCKSVDEFMTVVNNYLGS